jgi:hypothetical protein
MALINPHLAQWFWLALFAGPTAGRLVRKQRA